MAVQARGGEVEMAVEAAAAAAADDCTVLRNRLRSAVRFVGEATRAAMVPSAGAFSVTELSFYVTEELAVLFDKVRRATSLTTSCRVTAASLPPHCRLTAASLPPHY